MSDGIPEIVNSFDKDVSIETNMARMSESEDYKIVKGSISGNVASDDISISPNSKDDQKCAIWRTLEG